jgi:hypothetical protein
MIWLFDRDGEKLKYEICRPDSGDGYLLVVTQADGRQKIEEVGKPTELIERSVHHMRQLHDSGWKIG